MIKEHLHAVSLAVTINRSDQFAPHLVIGVDRLNFKIRQSITG